MVRIMVNIKQSYSLSYKLLLGEIDSIRHVKIEFIGVEYIRDVLPGSGWSALFNTLSLWCRPQLQMFQNTQDDVPLINICNDAHG